MHNLKRPNLAIIAGVSILFLTGCSASEEIIDRESVGQQIINELVAQYNDGDSKAMLKIFCRGSERFFSEQAEYNGRYFEDELEITEYSPAFDVLERDKLGNDSFLMSFRTIDHKDGEYVEKFWEEGSVIVQSYEENDWCISSFQLGFEMEFYHRNQPGQ